MHPELEKDRELLRKVANAAITGETQVEHDGKVWLISYTPHSPVEKRGPMPSFNDPKDRAK